MIRSPLFIYFGNLMRSVVRFGQFLLYLALFAVVPVTAGTALPYIDQGVRVIQSTPTTLEVEYRPRIEGFDTLMASGVKTLLPRIKGAKLADHLMPGEPSMLVISLPVSVPSATGFRIEQVTAQQVASYPAMITPVPTLDYIDLSTVPSYVCNQQAYSRSALSSWCTAQYTGQSRSTHIASLDVVAALYNGISGTIEIPASVRITVALVPTTVQEKPAKQDEQLFASTLNADVSSFWGEPRSPAMAKRAGAVTPHAHQNSTHRGTA